MLIYSSRKYDPFEQLQHIAMTHEKFFETGENERYLTTLDTHIFFPRELQLLFLATGFAIEAIYGGGPGATLDSLTAPLRAAAEKWSLLSIHPPYSVVSALLTTFIFSHPT